MVSVTLQITTPDDIDTAVQIESWVPAGLEPMDPNVQDDGSTANGCNDFLFRRRRGGEPVPFNMPSIKFDSSQSSVAPRWYGWWWYCPTFRRETMTDRVTYCKC